MIVCAGMSLGVKVLFTILAIIVALGLIALLYWSIMRERKRWNDELEERQGTASDKAEKKMEALIGAKQEFTLYGIEFVEHDEMLRTLGDIQCENAKGLFVKKLKRVFASSARISVEGDKIFVITPNRVNKKENEKLSNLILYEASTPVAVAGTLNVYFDVAVGVASFPYSGSTSQELLDNLHIALLNSKRMGYNHFVVYDDQLGTSETEEYKNYLEIKDAIKDNEFTLYYHPIVATGSKEVYAVETLLRWNHKTRGVLSPLVFLNILEQSGDINWVGLWSFEQLLKQKEQWQKSYPENDFLVSINISQKQIRNGSIVDELRKIVKRHHVPYTSVILEIAEAAAFSSEELVISNINKLSQLGFKIAIDNYGAELVSLNKLENLTLNMLKLEKKFFAASMNESGMSKGIFGLLIAFCKQRDISLVCMGIETEDEIAFAKANNILYAQGFYFSKPKNGKDVMQDIILTPWQA